MSAIGFRSVTSLVSAAIVLPLALSQTPSPSARGDVFNSASSDNNCRAVFKQTGEKINEEDLRKQAQLSRAQGYCKNDACKKKIQIDRAAAHADAKKKLDAARVIMENCEGKPRMDPSATSPSATEGNAAQGQSSTGRTLLKGGAVETGPAPVYQGNANGTGLPRMTGNVVYKHTTIVVTTAAGRLVGQGVAGPVSFTAVPKTYSKVEGFITSPSEFTITSLKDLRSREVLAPGERITVWIGPK